MYYPNGLGPLLKTSQRCGRDGWSEEQVVPLCRLSHLSGRRSHGQAISYFYLSNTFFIEYVTKVSDSVLTQVQYGCHLHGFNQLRSFQVAFLSTSRLCLSLRSILIRAKRLSISLHRAFLWENE